MAYLDANGVNFEIMAARQGKFPTDANEGLFAQVTYRIVDFKS